ncbi:MAG: methyl-accepting chemotaxis protein [Candidatus Krumholzibacteriaceae bacterium]
MKKRMPKDKKPVLTSPWKIGTFVSLLLVFVSLGVGCYLITFYHVDLKWIKIGSAGWSIDSYLFFREIYPLVAGVVLISLLAYFTIASAVRKYKFYLDSGQDYRTMISLAESIDDLTNPAQIARLSSYPELQAVLKNYGDQIREISQDLAEDSSGVACEELESEIDKLLGGNGSRDTELDGKEYASVYRKVKQLIDSNCSRMEGIEKRTESERRAYARAALAYGRILEAISGASEELLAITNFVGELASAAEHVTKEAAPTRGAGADSQEKALKAIVSDMENSVRKLEDGGHVLHEFSEENNGIAINLALMAARGNVDDHDLATFAERVRSTAERFHRLSGTVSSIAQGLLGTCYALKEKIGGAEPEAPGVDVGGFRAIVEIARRIEERSANLQKQLCSLGNELHDVHGMLQKDFSGDAPEAADLAPKANTAHMAGEAAARGERAGTFEQPQESHEFVVEHGKSWGGLSDQGPEAEAAKAADEDFSFKHLDAAEGRPAPGAAEALEDEPKSDYSDMSSLRDLKSPAEAEAKTADRPEEPRESGSWMEMPGHRWLKIDVEKTDVEEETGKIDVAVQAPARKTVQKEPASRKDDDEVVFESAEQAPLGAGTGADDEPIYDLFDLGAVEYVEEAPLQKR